MWGDLKASTGNTLLALKFLTLSVLSEANDSHTYSSVLSELLTSALATLYLKLIDVLFYVDPLREPLVSCNKTCCAASITRVPFLSSSLPQIDAGCENLPGGR